nr:MAG TPA: hypothetical protein [Caudoviricetes sp.]
MYKSLANKVSFPEAIIISSYSYSISRLTAFSACWYCFFNSASYSANVLSYSKSRCSNCRFCQ